MNAISVPLAALTASILCRPRRLALLAIVYSATTAQAQPTTATAQVEEPTASRPRDVDPLMAMVIDAVQENESRYRNLETTTTLTTEYGANEYVYTKRVETSHVVRQDELIHYRGTTEFQRDNTPPFRFERWSAFDGERTRSVEAGNSANIHLGRYEASQVYPPHTWAMMPLWVNIPLSVYLQGTEAVAAHPKTRRVPRPAGTVYEMTKVECEYLGEKMLGDIRCHKIRCQRWSRLTSAPQTHILWLAPERNYLCVKVEAMYAESLRDRSLVEEFREIAPGLWLPSRIKFTTYAPRALPGNSPRADTTQFLNLDNVSVDPAKPTSFFRDIEIPAGIPVFTISAEGTMIGSPMHPTPAEMSSGTTLQEIIANVRLSEALFNHYDSTRSDTYRHGDEENSYLESNLIRTVSSKTTVRNLLTQGKFFREENAARGNERLATSSSQMIVAFDGNWRRQFNNDRFNDRPQLSASLQKGSAGRLSVDRPHLALLENFTDGPSLADYLAGVEAAPRSRGRRQAEYVGDDVINELVCHKLSVDQFAGQSPEPTLSSTIWLARDRNYLPVRHDSYRPARSAKLPDAVSLVLELREGRPGLWFPDRVAIMKLRNFEATGACENRVIVSWRRDQEISSLDLNPNPDPTLFSELNVPQGTDVVILDEQGDVVARRTQPQDGNITITEEEYQELLKNRPARRR